MTDSDEDFSVDWLSLRALADSQARSQRLLNQALCWVRAQRLANLQRPLRVIDLGCGSGANLRALAPHLGARQNWLLLDHDQRLLQAASDHLSRWAATAGMQVVTIDPQRRSFRSGLRRIDVQLRNQDLIAAPLPDWPADLISASALLDLCSASWLTQLANSAAKRRCALLMTLSYSGQLAWQPADPLDAKIQHDFNRHQRSEKSLGRALGPDAARYLIGRLRRLGYRVAVAASPWRLGAQHSELQRVLVEGIYQAVRQLATSNDDAQAWQQRRLAALTQTPTHPPEVLRVSHLDLFATLR